MRRNYQQLTKIFAVFCSLLVLSFSLPVYAASLTSVSDTLTTTTASTASNHSIKFTTPTGITAGQNFTITFPAGFAMGSVAYTDVDVLDGASQLTLASTPATTTWGVGVAGQIMTISSATGTIAAGHVITVNIGTNATNQTTGINQITNPALGTYVIAIGGSMADSGNLAVSVTATSNNIPVTATINPSVTLTVSNTTLNLNTLTPTAVASAGPNAITIASNSKQGYTISIKDTGDGAGNQGLWNSLASKRIFTAALGGIAFGTEGYGGTCDVGSASGTCTTANFNNDASAQVGPFATTSAGVPFASLAAGTKPGVSGDSFNLRVKAAINNQTDPGAYADTLTVLATMNF